MPPKVVLSSTLLHRIQDGYHHDRITLFCWHFPWFTQQSWTSLPLVAYMGSLKSLPVVTWQTQDKQPIESIETQSRSHADTSNGGHPPAPWPPELAVVPDGFAVRGCRVMILNATFNNISVISWRSVLLVEETRVHRENHRLAVSHWQFLSHNVLSIVYLWLLDRHRISNPLSPLKHSQGRTLIHRTEDIHLLRDPQNSLLFLTGLLK
jgi:hypothetical protein